MLLEELAARDMLPDLGIGVIGAGKVGLIPLLEALAAVLWEVLVIMKDTPGSICCKVNALGEADVCQIQHAQDVNADGLNLHRRQHFTVMKATELSSSQLFFQAPLVE